MRAFLRPRDGSDSIVLRNFTQSRDLLRFGGPDVNRASEANGQDVAAGPVDKVQVEVIFEVWSVQHFERDLWDFPDTFKLSRVVI